jgi:chromosomal replication initiator protein
MSVPISSIMNCTRKREVVFARQVSMIMIKQFTQLSLHDIGVIFDRHHSTVISAQKRLNDLCYTEPETKATVDGIRDQVLAAV